MKNKIYYSKKCNFIKNQVKHLNYPKTQQFDDLINQKKEQIKKLLIRLTMMVNHVKNKN